MKRIYQYNQNELLKQKIKFEKKRKEFLKLQEAYRNKFLELSPEERHNVLKELTDNGYTEEQIRRMFGV